MSEGVCPNCGTDQRRRDLLEKVSLQYAELRYQFGKQAASHGRERALWQLQQLEHDEEKRWLQDKVRKQKKVITRLEQKLRNRNQPPYEETKAES